MPSWPRRRCSEVISVRCTVFPLGENDHKKLGSYCEINGMEWNVDGIYGI